jgi:hypothetical protein
LTAQPVLVRYLGNAASCPTRAILRRYQADGASSASPGLTGFERTMMIAVVALREIREGIRDLGLDPPALPDWLRWLDEADS